MTGQHHNLKHLGATLSPASPQATGDAGIFFEQHVDALFLALLLTKGIPPCLADAHVSEVRFQTRNQGWHTDDILARVQDASGSTRNLAMQVKLDFTVSASRSNEQCREVISGAWRDFKNAEIFHCGLDLLGIVVSRPTQVLVTHFRSLLNCAGTCQTFDEFSRRIDAKGYLSAKSRQQYRDICQIIQETQPNNPPDSDIWQFLRSFRFLAYDFDPSGGQSLAQIMNLLTLTAIDVDPRRAAGKTWHALLELAAQGIPTAATYSYSDLPEDLRTAHRCVGVGERGPIRQLREHSKMVLERISMVIGDGLHIARHGLVANLLQQLDSSKLVVVTGPAGSGKSAVAREVCDTLAEKAYVFAFRAEEFATPHLDDTLHRAQVPFQAKTLFDLLSSHERKIVLVESVERLLEKSERDAFSDLLALVTQDSTWQTILTCREYFLDRFRSTFLQQAGAPHAILEVPPLDDSELEEIAKGLPLLNRPLANQRLRTLLRNPYMLEMAARMNWTEHESLPNDERAFRERVWQDVIRKESHGQDSLPPRRGQTFKDLAVRRARALEPFTPCGGLDRQALEALRGDGLIEYSPESDGLAAPSHDVLEDWAILKWLEDAHATSGGDHLSFLADVGSHPAIRRAYRQWLGGLVETKPGSASAFALAVSLDDRVASQTRDDTLVSLMLSEHAANWLRQLEESLLADDCQLLIHLIHLLRVACMAPPGWFPDVRGRASSTFLVPRGRSWPVILEFVANNLNGLLPGHDRVVLGLLKDWARSVSVWTPHPDGLDHAGAITSTLLAYYGQKGYAFDEETKAVLEVMAKIPTACKQQFLALIERSCGDDRREHIPDTFAEMLLQAEQSTFACRDFPDEVVRLAEARWKQKPPESGDHYDFYGATELADVFGLSHHGEHGHFPASAYQGPFLPLLRYHPKKGLTFIVNLLNHAVQSYAVDASKKIEPPWQVQLVLKEGTSVKQWCNPRLWCLYRGSSVGPNVLQSALMALEAWLLERCEQGDDVTPVLDWILAGSNNAALSAVVASAAVAYPDMLGASALPLLACREFVQIDLERVIKDQTPVTASLDGWLAALPNKTLYTQERKKSDCLAHRRSQLEHLAVQLQGGSLENEVLSIIDRHRDLLPPLEQQSEEDKVWRLALNRMDLRRYEVREQLEDGRLLIQSGAPDTDLQQIVDQATQDLVPFQKGSELLSWGLAVFRGGQEAEAQRGEWRERLSDAVKAASLRTEPDNSTPSRVIAGGVSYIAAVCVRDHWDDLEPSQREWCIDTVTKAVSDKADSDDYLFVVGRNSMDAARPAAFILSLVLCKSLGPELRERVKNALFLAFTHACAEVMEYAAEGVGSYLWPADPDLARVCVGICARRAQLICEMSRANQEKRFRERIGYDEICRRVNLRVRQAASAMMPIDPDELLSLVIDALEGERDMELLLAVLGHPASGDIGRAFVSRLLQLLVRAWDERKRDRHGGSHADSGAEIGWVRRLAGYCLLLPPEDALQVCKPLLDAIEVLPDKVADFVQHMVVEEDLHRSGKAFWSIWQAVADATATAERAEHMEPRYYWSGERLIQHLFLRAPWKDGTRHWEPLEKDWHRVDNFFQALPLSAVSLEAYLSYLYHVGAKSLPRAFTLIEGKVAGSDLGRIRSASNTAFYLESLLGRFVYGKPAQVKSDRQLRASVLRLLDAMVESGSSAAYIMRDDFVTPLSPLP